MKFTHVIVAVYRYVGDGANQQRRQKNYRLRARRRLCSFGG